MNETVVISVGHMVGHMIERKCIIDYIELARRMPDVRAAGKLTAERI